MSPNSKKCSRCDGHKSLVSFGKDSYNKDKLKNICKNCYKIERERDYNKKYNLLYRERNKEKAKVYNKSYSSDNKEKLSNNKKEYYLKNKKAILIKSKEYQKNNQEKINKYRRNRIKSDPNFKIACYLRSRLTGLISGKFKAGSFVKDLGCSFEELKAFLEQKFKPGVSWDNYGKWHIDHVHPLSKFDLTDRSQFLKACHYTNLQPLWATENLKKGNKTPE